MNKYILVLTIALFSACGGGGGSDDKFAGKWDFNGIKVSDSCNLGLDNTASTTWIVNQDEDIIAVESGSLFLNGNVNEEGDGWDVSGSRPSTCQGGVDAYAISTTINKDDGTAGLSLAVQCNGITCTVSYGGTVRRSGKVVSAAEDLEIENIITQISSNLSSESKD